MKSELDVVINEFAQYVLFGERNVKNSYKAEKISKKNEKFTKLDKNITDINVIYKEFEKIRDDYCWNRAEYVFYKQAKYLENFECDYPEGPYYKRKYTYFQAPRTYLYFSLIDFKNYFSWRTKIRKGIFEKNEGGFEHIYIDELLNKIGCKDTEDALNKLIDFWKGYRQCCNRIDFCMPEVIKEYYIANTIKMPYYEILKKFPVNIPSKTHYLKDIKNGIYKNKIDFFSEISSYKIAKSKLLDTQYGYILDECIEKIFSRIENELKTKGISLREMLVKERIADWYWGPLSEYSIYDREVKNKKIVIDELEKYEYQNGRWIETMHYVPNSYNKFIGYILKTMEYYIRDYISFSKLKLPDYKDIKNDLYYRCTNKDRVIINKIYQIDLHTIIQNETIKYLESINIEKDSCKKKKAKINEFEKEEKIEVVFNQEQFDKIREKSAEIQNALVIEEPEEETPIFIKPENNYQAVAKTIDENTNMFKVFACDLTQSEKEIIQVLLEKQDVENKMLQIAQTQNEMLEVMVSNINDKALETIGDTIIESDMSSIYDDYANEIKQVI